MMFPLVVFVSSLALGATTTTTSVATEVRTVPITRQEHAKKPMLRAISRASGSSNELSSAPLVFSSGGFFISATLSDGNSYFLLIDTGSSDTWFRGQFCSTPNDSTDTSCIGRNVTVNPLSHGLTDLKLSFYTQYGAGFLVGSIYKASVAIDGVSSTIAVGVSNIEGQLQGIDGILGLGYSSLGEISSQITPRKGVSGNWFDASSFKNKQFGVYLSKAANGFTGELTLGGYDTKRYTGNIVWIPLIKQPSPGSYGYFSFSIASWTWSVGANYALLVPGGKGNLSTPASDPQGATNFAIADTGTTLLMIATTPSNKIAAALNLAYDSTLQLYSLPCQNSYPPVNFHYGKTTFSIPSSVYTIVSTGGCYFGIVGGGDGITIFGDVFTRAYYTMFDKANFRVGYALAK